MVFYTWGESTNVLLLLLLGLINYLGGQFLSTSKHARISLACFIALNLFVLIGYKYAFWLLTMVMPGISSEKQILLPLGISFFTFHAISYLIDIYRRDIMPAKSGIDFLAYFCMFPHLVAGPIVRFSQIENEIYARGPDKSLFSFGMYRFLVGLNKKVIIANTVSVMADTAFSMSDVGNLHFFDAWLGIMAYAIQIYFDFSGYSDMAIGLAAMAGFRFKENFHRPYSSASIQEFWRRWHVSLSTWFRDYLYFPLGGSRGSSLSTYRNLLIVFLVCGLWHGAEITFILWGLWHGTFLIFERISSVRIVINKIPKLITRCYTLIVVLIGWVLFRAENIEHAGIYLCDLFSFSLAPIALLYHKKACIALLAGILICLLPDRVIPQPTSSNEDDYPMVLYGFHIVLGTLSLSFLMSMVRNPFIYFNF
jgi:alginate O-acetyltransferase complex protein AlgI